MATSQGLLMKCAGILSKFQVQKAAVATAVVAATGTGTPHAAAFSYLSATPTSAMLSWHRGISCSPRAAFASAKESIEVVENRLDQLQNRVERLEALEAASSVLSRLTTWLDDARQSPQLVTSNTMADLFTPAALVEAGPLGTAESVSEVLPLLQKLVNQGGASRQYITNVVAARNSPVPTIPRDDNNIVKASAYSLVVQPVAGAMPTLVSMHILKATLEKGMDERWRIKRIQFIEVAEPVDAAGEKA